MLFTDNRLPRKGMRAQALGPAICAGHLDLVEYILNSGWGTVDLAADAIVVLEDLVMGMLYSPLPDFCFQLFGLCESLSTTEHFFEVMKPDMDCVLTDIAGRSPQRADVVAWLLDHGLLLQQAQPSSSRIVSNSDMNAENPSLQVESHTPRSTNIRHLENALLQAVKGGNEKILLLLLNRGANP
ncbi:hypothetical protein EK21DRAFT_27601, partial [Setomelanomma holmii]